MAARFGYFDERFDEVDFGSANLKREEIMLYNQEIHDYFRELCASLIAGCRLTASDGTTLYTPDGISSYNGHWTRDFSYMMEYAGFCIPDEDAIACIRYTIAHRREDGWMPDRVTGEGIPVYAAGILTAPVGEANLDNTPFLIFQVHDLYLRLPAEKFMPLFEEWAPHLARGLFLIDRDERGLVWNDPAKPHSPYGFTDTVCKTGTLFMESLLYWRACRFLEEMYISCGQPDAPERARCAREAAEIEANLSCLRDGRTGAYWAASEDCRQIDVWGMAYLLYIGFPCTPEEEQGILRFLMEKYDSYMYQGQVRHLPAGEYWEKLLIEVEPETYQNGAYWATATGWVLWCLAKADPALAERALREAWAYFREEGSYECVNEGYQKLPSYVVSAVNLYGGCDRVMREYAETQSAAGG